MINRIILFGLPGTGKTTAAKYLSEKYLELDFGSDKLTEEQLSKIRSLTKQLVNQPIQVISSYPQYFSDDTLLSINDAIIVGAIPSSAEAKDLVLSRFERRDGKSSFLKLYKKNIDKGVEDGTKKITRLKGSKSKQIVIEYYDEKLREYLKRVLVSRKYLELRS